MLDVVVLALEDGTSPFQDWFHSGPGYRIYFGRDGRMLIVLIGGGTKKGRARDIRAAQRLWKDHKNRKRRS